MKDKIDFIIIGYPKSGTTSLHDWLNQHPGITMYQGEINHHNSGEKLPEIEKVGLLGLRCVDYIHSYAYKNIDKKTKIIIVLRDKKEQIKSYKRNNFFHYRNKDYNSIFWRGWLNKWINKFDCLILDCDDLKQDSYSAYLQVLNFLKIAPNFTPEITYLNRSTKGGTIKKFITHLIKRIILKKGD